MTIFQKSNVLLVHLGFIIVLIGYSTVNSYSQCNPQVVVDSPSGEIRPNAEARFTARIINSGSINTSNLQFNWTLSDQNFLITRKRQNNRIIFVKAIDAQRANRKLLTAQVVVSGLPTNCNIAKNDVIFRDRLILNAPPTINSIVLSTAEVIVCPSDPCKNNPLDSKVKLTVSATDPDNDVLSYIYKVSGGKIVKQEGANAEWDLAGVEPGTYFVTVSIDDDELFGTDGSAPRTEQVIVRKCSPSNSINSIVLSENILTR